MNPCKSADYFIKVISTLYVGYGARFQLGKLFIIKNIFGMKNLTDFRKTVETVVDPRLIVTCDPLFIK